MRRTLSLVASTVALTALLAAGPQQDRQDLSHFIRFQTNNISCPTATTSPSKKSTARETRSRSAACTKSKAHTNSHHTTAPRGWSRHHQQRPAAHFRTWTRRR